MTNAENMIKDAINRSDELRAHAIEIFAQGSYANNTNVRRESDVDICVTLTSTTYNEYPVGLSGANYGFTKSRITFPQYRTMIKNALKNKFGAEHIIDGNKSIKIDENSYHVKADVVPSFMYKNYAIIESRDSAKYIEGIKFFAKDGAAVINYPKIHKRNGIEKNNSTGGVYKRLVRIMKHIKNDMKELGQCEGDIISSFLLECLVYHIPDSEITKYRLWQDTVKNAIAYLYKKVEDGQANNWYEVSGYIKLFDSDRKWKIMDVKDYLYRKWNYLGYEN